ncbi:hypothetical protein [Clostridium estertheticum]|uniref:hypothetical protein n=1 Tax=Clostridium estertheticum TaxID=238834 RepID=UPI001C0BDD29|nr:hypothetical protein [Clostridium estertheticum]MBU3186516.1 hypothetical protein [Clostridium estertheticum]
MIILCGCSASGKDTLMNKLAEITVLKPVVSYTTRGIRSNETEGVSYNFISDEEFKSKSASGFFIEESEYIGFHYAMAKEDCSDNRIVVVNPQGLRSLVRSGINITSFYIAVDERERLIRLANRGDDITELCRRIISDRDTFRGIESEVDYVVKNNNIKVAAFEIIQKLKGVLI